MQTLTVSIHQILGVALSTRFSQFIFASFYCFLRPITKQTFSRNMPFIFLFAGNSGNDNLSLVRGENHLDENNDKVLRWQETVSYLGFLSKMTTDFRRMEAEEKNTRTKFRTISSRLGFARI
jgi:hypothetical protein